MTNSFDLTNEYSSLDSNLRIKGQDAIEARSLLTFPYEFPQQPSEITIDTDEFTAVCPWTGLPDYGTLTLLYFPSDKIIELKSLKYYLLSFRDVGIVQEHAANRILRDLVSLCHPRFMKVDLDYKIRGGLHTKISTQHPPPPVPHEV